MCAQRENEKCLLLTLEVTSGLRIPRRDRDPDGSGLAASRTTGSRSQRLSVFGIRPTARSTRSVASDLRQEKEAARLGFLRLWVPGRWRHDSSACDRSMVHCAGNNYCVVQLDRYVGSSPRFRIMHARRVKSRRGSYCSDFHESER